MKQLDNLIPLVKDNVMREALEIISKELTRIHNTPPVKEDLKSITHAINAITGKTR